MNTPYKQSKTETELPIQEKRIKYLVQMLDIKSDEQMTRVYSALVAPTTSNNSGTKPDPRRS
ncbi:MAG TPA: hypothetical protein VGF30_02870 [Bacteroidia bacterium]